MTQEVALLVFSPFLLTTAEQTYHSLDIRWTLLYYNDRTKPFRIDHSLFMCYSGHKKDRIAFLQLLSRLVVAAILFYYKAVGKLCPLEACTHSIRALGSSAAFHEGSCSSASAKLQHSWLFMKYYALDLQSKRDANIGKAVFQTLFQ